MRVQLVHLIQIQSELEFLLLIQKVLGEMAQCGFFFLEAKMKSMLAFLRQ